MIPMTYETLSSVDPSMRGIQETLEDDITPQDVGLAILSSEHANFQLAKKRVTIFLKLLYAVMFLKDSLMKKGIDIEKFCYEEWTQVCAYLDVVGYETQVNLSCIAAARDSVDNEKHVLAHNSITNHYFKQREIPERVDEVLNFISHNAPSEEAMETIRAIFRDATFLPKSSLTEEEKNIVGDKIINTIANNSTAGFLTIESSGNIANMVNSLTNKISEIPEGPDLESEVNEAINSIMGNVEGKMMFIILLALAIKLASGEHTKKVALISDMIAKLGKGEES
jgi:hypothetical protein